MKIKAITPLGTFLSKDLPFNDSQKQNIKNLFSEKIKDLEYLTIPTEKGDVYFGTEVIKNSVFVILD